MINGVEKNVTLLKEIMGEKRVEDETWTHDNNLNDSWAIEPDKEFFKK